MIIKDMRDSGKLRVNGRLNIYCLLLFIVLFSFFSCENKIENPFSKTIIVYMIADNNLDYFAVKDINEMEKGVSSEDVGKLIVYVDRADGASPSHPVIYEITHDETDTITSHIVSVYQEQNSANSDIFNKVLTDIIDDYPADDYGLVLWSHGTAWYPEGASLSSETNSYSTTLNCRLPITKTFGKDDENELNINDLKEALPINFDFIIFDACYMGAIEVAYELKDKTKYIISSSTEVLSAGYPYQQIIDNLLSKDIDYSLIANDFFTSFDTLSNSLQSATVSVINTSKLDALANCVADIMDDSLNLVKITCDSIQQYTVNRNNYLFDFDDFIRNVTSNKELYNVFVAKLNETILYKANTSSILEDLQINYFSGLSIYIPNTKNSKYYEYYETLDWYQNSKYSNYFKHFCIDY